VTERIALRCDDGWILRGECRHRADAPAVVVCGHAMMVDRRTLDRPRGAGLTSTLFDAGLSVVAFDARGHGKSVPRAEQGGRWTYDDFVRQDVPAALRFARSIAGGRPVAVLGHSLIGHAALIAAGLGHAADAIVAYAPNLWAPHLESSAVVRAAKLGTICAWVATTRARGYFDARAFGLGSDGEPAVYVAQYLSMWRQNRLTSPDGTIDYERALARAEVPVLAFSSVRDRLYARPSSVASFLALMEHAPVTHRILDGPGAPTHMGFVLDPAARPIWEESARFIVRATASK
jgi:predicted alpha/beta hydrolase